MNISNTNPEITTKHIVINKEMKINSLEKVYYLIQGEVDVYFEGKKIITKKKDFILANTEHILRKSLDPQYNRLFSSNKEVYYVIKPKSIVCEFNLNISRNNDS